MYRLVICDSADSEEFSRFVHFSIGDDFEHAPVQIVGSHDVFHVDIRDSVDIDFLVVQWREYNIAVTGSKAYGDHNAIAGYRISECPSGLVGNATKHGKCGC